MTDPAIRSRIEQILSANRVVLFMKGTPHAPQCGFSAATAGRLDALLDGYCSIDVLADPAIRQGIKEYGNWPTIPQLYVDGELVGGADIVQSMHDSGELHRLLGVPEPDRTPPTITITDAAAAAIRKATEEAGGLALFLVVDAAFQPQFELREAGAHDIVSIANGIELHFDLAGVPRARDAVIDWVSTPRGEGLSINLPAAPAAVRSIDVQTLHRRLDAGTLTVIDVRPPQDRAIAPFPAARVLDAASRAQLEGLPKDTPLAFLCHHGNSSRQAAEHFRALGFTDVHNVEGGIDAWSREIDPAVPRY
jgi:monothiol glutaredoxin